MFNFVFDLRREKKEIEVGRPSSLLGHNHHHKIDTSQSNTLCMRTAEYRSEQVTKTTKPEKKEKLEDEGCQAS